ncbi:MAG: YcbK family protein [Elusimicrobiales bacterium]|nr:YcbK family protein [Elusimicrobiales bacterium]
MTFRLFILSIVILLAGCMGSKKHKFVHIDFPDKSPAEIAAESKAMEKNIPEKETGQDSEEEHKDDLPADEQPLTQMEIVEAEKEGDEVFSISEGYIPPAPAPQNFGGNGSITIRRNESKEVITVTYRNKDGSYDQAALDKINHIMRCYEDNSERDIAVKLVELLDAIEDHFGKKGITVLSGYRTPEYNRKIKGAAKNSLHILGWAADIRIPGYKSSQISTFARKKYAGGVGYYPYTGFVHVDVGSVRYWQQTRRKKKSKKRAAVKRRATRRAGSKKYRVSRTPAKPRTKAVKKSAGKKK